MSYFNLLQLEFALGRLFSPSQWTLSVRFGDEESRPRANASVVMKKADQEHMPKRAHRLLR
jgi:hypothetical protein